jgi:hypothetical protein
MDCVRLLEKRYLFNISRHESMKMIWDGFRDGSEVRAFLDALAATDASGDIYARLK